MDFPSLTVHDRQHEFHFGPADVRAFASEFGREDLRSRWDKVMLRKMAPKAPAWTLTPELFEFTAGGGSIGVGSLWTRPVALEPGATLAGAYFNLLERREAHGAWGEQNIIAHVRENSEVGDGVDLAKRVFPIHAEGEPNDASWHGQFIDLGPLLSQPRPNKAFLAIEIQSSCTRHESLASSIAFRYRALGLSLVTRHATQASISI